MRLHYTRWMSLYNEFQQALDRGKPTTAETILHELTQTLEKLATEGLDLLNTAQCFLTLAKAELARHERMPDKCQEILRSIRPTPLMDLQQTSVIKANIEITIGNIHLTQGNLASASIQYEEATRHCRLANNPGLLANALFNLGTCLQLTRKEESAIEKFIEAASIYRALDDHQRHADSIHQIGNTLSFLRKYTEAISAQNQALLLNMQLKNHMGVWRTADDLSRTKFQVAKQQQEHSTAVPLLEDALNDSIIADFSAEQVWRAAKTEGQMVDLSEQLINHAITQCEIALCLGRVDLFLGVLARIKGRIRGHLLPRIDELFPDWPEDLVRGFDTGSPVPATIAVCSSLEKLSTPNDRVAIIDQLAAHNGKLLIGVYLYNKGKVAIDYLQSRLPPDTFLGKTRPKTSWNRSPSRGIDNRTSLPRCH